MMSERKENEFFNAVTSISIAEMHICSLYKAAPAVVRHSTRVLEKLTEIIEASSLSASAKRSCFSSVSDVLHHINSGSNYAKESEKQEKTLSVLRAKRPGVFVKPALAANKPAAKKPAAKKPVEKHHAGRR